MTMPSPTAAARPMRTPLATYRLQFRNAIDFDAAARLVPYLARLGVSHLYSSPYLEATPGSTHGYDVVDPARVDPALGGEAGLARLRAGLREAGLGEVLDIVPNHMAISGRENPWWWDVLENGPSSRFARFFDVDWDPPESYLRNIILLPILGDHYGRVLEAGELQLSRDAATFSIRYHDHVLPIAPRSLDRLLGDAAGRLGWTAEGWGPGVRGGSPDDAPERPAGGGDDTGDDDSGGSGGDDGDGAGSGTTRNAAAELAFIAEGLGRLPSSAAADRTLARRRNRDKNVLLRLLDGLLERSEATRRAIDAEIDELNDDPDRLDELIGRQNYRLAFWRAAGRELGYRRFFDVTTLAGIRQEDPDVFEATHPLIRDWLASDELDGLRVDHPDGLRDPKEYLERLRSIAPRAWIVAEKILEPGERLREDWPVAGTTGYDFAFLLDNLLVDPANEAALSRAYAEFSGEARTFREIGLESKRLILREVLASELARLAGLMLEVCERHRRYRDYTRGELHEALLEVAACFPVYRSYVRAGEGEIGAADRRAIDEAIEVAGRERPTIDSRLLEFIRSILVLDVRGDVESELVMRFQQLTGAVMAKGIEDTAFYRYTRLVSLNEVGGDPGVFGLAPEVFHRECEARQAEWPSAMLATSTHDTKRSEDVRARLALLSEMPERWLEAVTVWSALAERHRSGGWPDRNTEWLYYETLVGAWPLTVDRAAAYMEKASREAKSVTSWAAPNAEFDAALHAFVEGTLGDDEFRGAVEAFVGPLVEPGRLNALAQTLLKLTAPGVPDVYQGSELWDLSLVDPDNRRPVDFERRSALLGEIESLDPEAAARLALARSDDGLPKLWLTLAALRVRAANPDAFAPGSRGSYQALAARGPCASHAVAFVRGRTVATVVPRLVAGLAGDWAGTVLELPDGRWRNALAGEVWDGGRVPIDELLGRFPVALLVRESDAASTPAAQAR